MKFKRLIPALCMLLVSAILLGTSTFAWFSMNTSVSATDMQVVVKSDNTYLQIGTGNDDTASEIHDADPNTSVALTVSDAQAKVYPSKPAEDATEAGLLNTTTGKKVGDTAIETAGAIVNSTATAAAVTNWYTATAEAVDAPDMLAGSARQLTSFDGYVIQKTVYLTVAEGSNHAHNLTVTPTITQKTGGSDISAVKVLVCTDDGGFAILDSTSGETDISGSNTELTDTTVRTVYIYIYYDGSEDPVFTNNAANLKGADISLDFDVDAVPAA